MFDLFLAFYPSLLMKCKLPNASIVSVILLFFLSSSTAQSTVYLVAYFSSQDNSRIIILAGKTIQRI
jgi:hypothetical protein